MASSFGGQFLGQFVAGNRDLRQARVPPVELDLDSIGIDYLVCPDQLLLAGIACW
jgi:hypothetical protein